MSIIKLKPSKQKSTMDADTTASVPPAPIQSLEQVFSVQMQIQQRQSEAQLVAERAASVRTFRDTVNPFRGEFNGKVAVDFERVWENFTTLCTDTQPENAQAETYAMAFATKVIYEISNEARQIKPNGRDRSWNLIIPAQGETPEAVINVATYKNVDAAHSYTYRFGGRRIFLSMGLANMVAVEILCRVCMAFGYQILTPHGRAVYAMKDLPKIAEKIGVSVVETCCLINRSTLGTPYQLKDSSFACAVAAAMVITRKMAYRDEARKIVNKITKGYMRDNKILDMDHFKVWAQYATGGIPEEYTLEKLQRVADASRLN